uniref:Uncharacterized protein n=1 Tax=Arundo donax TaxID=35708 RepID=A0A0A8ZQ11_ARUDO
MICIASGRKYHHLSGDPRFFMHGEDVTRLRRTTTDWET